MPGSRSFYVDAKRVAPWGLRHMQRKLLGLLMVLASSAFAQTSEPLAEDDPAVWAARAVRAENLRTESSQMRRAADAQRLQAEIACRKKFLENACRDSARERWIEEINKVRALEIEAVGLERNQRAHDIAMREKARASAPPRPQLILPLGAPQSPAQPKPGAAPLKTNETSPATPKPQGKPLDTRKRADHEERVKRDSGEKAQEAADRAAQAKKDAAGYAERAKEHAKKQAEREKNGGAEKQSAPLK